MRPLAAQLARAIAPHPETALACQIALAPPEVAREAWDRWLAYLGAGGGIIGASHATGRVLPLFAGRLKTLGLADHPLAPRLRGIQRRVLAGNMVLWSGLRPLLERFLAWGLRVALVGGIGRARAVYPDFGTRYLQRVDLWIPPEELTDALAIIRETRDWHPRFSVVSEPPVSDRHIFSGPPASPSTDVPRPASTTLVVRSHLIPESLGHGSDPFSRCSPLEVDGLSLLQPAPEHAIIQVAVDALEAARENASERYADWLTDLALTIDGRAVRAAGSSPAFDRASLVAEATRYDVPLTLATALTCLPRVGVALPSGVLAGLGPHGDREARALEARVAETRPFDGVWRDYRHAIAPASPPLEAAVGFVRYLRLRLGVRGPADVVRVARPALDRLYRRLR